jgi:carboxyl-terminal processing protease
VRDGLITIVAPLPGGPALEAGIQTGDRIIQVNDKPLHDATVEEAQKALRGAPGSVVKLTIERPGVTAPLKFALTRREIRVRSVQHPMMVANGVGYVALSIFSEESAPDLRRAIDSLRAAGMTSLIFDMRGNPGGLLDQGVGIADLFLDPGQRIVSMVGRTPESSRTYVDREPQRWATMPVTVLVDSNSASAAEIVAGALQDHDRALLVGRTTYGKGSAQNVFPLGSAGAVKLTTALWYTPSGRSIDKRRAAQADSASGDTTKARPRYRTDDGRTVLGGGGITPDVILPTVGIVTSDTVFTRALDSQIPQFRDALTDYALSLKASGAIKQRDFAVTPEMRAELLRRMRSRGITIDAKTYDAAGSLIDRVLGYEVARYVFGENAEFARRLKDDPGVAAAIKLTAGAGSPKALLQRSAR